MKTFLMTPIRKIKENKSLLEKKLSVKVEIQGKQVSIVGSEINEFIAAQVFHAIELGFDIETSLMITETDFILEIIEIKNLTKRHNLKEVRARLIGKEGRTKQLVEELSGCYIALKDNEVGVIGEAGSIKTAMNAVTKIIQGSKQSSVYAYLEKQRKVLHPTDLGLKINEE